MDKVNLKRAKETLDNVVSQAKDSVKILEALQKEGVTRAKSLMQMQAKDLAQLLNNDTVKSSLKKLGLATRSEVRDLERKVEDLASELRAQIAQVSKAAKKSNQKKTNEEAEL